jgi:hypothetical protein
LLTVSEQDQDGTGSVLTLLAAAELDDIYHCCVYSKKTPDDGQRNCPKHENFYSKINLRNLA